jgi:3-oxoacyl-[acyl-carrier-protein] synthase II
LPPRDGKGPARVPAFRRPPEERAVVTGWGLVTCLGGSVDSTWAAAAAGRSGIRELTLFDPRGLPCRVAGEVHDEWLPPDGLAPHEEVGGRPYRLLRAAAEEAARQGGLSAVEDRSRIALVLGGHANTPPISDLEMLANASDAAGHLDLLALGREASYGPDRFHSRRCDLAPALLARALDVRGPTLPIVSACAAGGQAMGEALRLLRERRADLVVAGGTECQLTFSAFIGCVLLGALAKRITDPTKASRPFDRRRNGFVMAEGAAVVVMETLASARARGRRVLGEILGYGDSADGFRITDMHPEGQGGAQAMAAALADAGLEPGDVEYVNAHGTSTPLNDPTETMAIKSVLGEHARRVPVSSNKSMMGHSFGAAGAIEAVLTMKGMAERTVLPTINLETPDPRCDLDYVPNVARPLVHRVALSNSFGFGGQNACLALAAGE